MFLLSQETELTPALLHKILDKFTTSVQPKRQRWKNQYDGKHIILQKAYSDPTKPCSRIVTNLCKVVADTYNGYITGKPVTYTSNDNIDDVQEVLNYNDDESANSQWLLNALKYGVGYELQWLDNDAQVRYSQIDPMNCFAVHSADLEKKLLYFVYWYEVSDFDDDNLLCIEVYDSHKKSVYHAHGLIGSLEFVEDKPHNFGDVPVSVFYLNEEEEPIFAQGITLNDAYNELQSCEVDDFSAWCDAYLTLIGADIIPEDVAQMKENRVLVLPEGAQAAWLTKNASDTQVKNMLENIRKDFFKVTAAPDMSDENFMAQSGEAIKYKLVGFENSASGIVTNFTKAIQRRIELICNILKLKATDTVWRDININFVRNLPVNMLETINMINGLKGTVSDETLLSQLPFITDVQSELELVKKQKEESMALYPLGAGGGFGFNEEEEDEEV